MKKFLILGIILFSSLLFMVGCEKESAITSEALSSEVQLLEIAFDKGVSIEKLLSVEEIEGISFVSIASKFVDKNTGEIHYGGKTFTDGEEFSVLEYINAANGAFIDMIVSDDVDFSKLTLKEVEIEKLLQTHFMGQIIIRY